MSYLSIELSSNMPGMLENSANAGVCVSRYASAQEDGNTKSFTGGSQICKFFSLATDVAQTEDTGSSHADEADETSRQSPSALSLHVLAQEEFGTSSYKKRYVSPGSCELSSWREYNTRYFRRDSSNSFLPPASLPATGFPLVAQVEALLCTKSNAGAAGEKGLSRLLGTVYEHAEAAGDLAHQYACAANVAWTEANKALVTCSAQWKRLMQARQAYLFVLRLFSQPQPGTCTDTVYSAQDYASRCDSGVISDLLWLEDIRCSAELLQNNQAHQERTELNQLQEACTRDLSSRATVSLEPLKRLFVTEEAALLLHQVRSPSNRPCFRCMRYNSKVLLSNFCQTLQLPLTIVLPSFPASAAESFAVSSGSAPAKSSAPAIGVARGMSSSGARSSRGTRARRKSCSQRCVLMHPRPQLC